LHGGRPARDDVARGCADARRREAAHPARNTYGKCTSFSSLYFCSLPADVTCVYSRAGYCTRLLE
jgi:hypothetical protein